MLPLLPRSKPTKLRKTGEKLLKTNRRDKRLQLKLKLKNTWPIKRSLECRRELLHKTSISKRSVASRLLPRPRRRLKELHSGLNTKRSTEREEQRLKLLKLPRLKRRLLRRLKRHRKRSKSRQKRKLKRRSKLSKPFRMLLMQKPSPKRPSWIKKPPKTRNFRSKSRKLSKMRQLQRRKLMPRPPLLLSCSRLKKL